MFNWLGYLFRPSDRYYWREIEDGWQLRDSYKGIPMWDITNRYQNILEAVKYVLTDLFSPS